VENLFSGLLAGAGAIGLLGGALAAIARWGVRPVVGLIRQVREFLEDWRGEPDRPGVPGRRGVMERLERIEWHVGNGSEPRLRDVVNDTRAELARLKRQVEEKGVADA